MNVETLISYRDWYIPFRQDTLTLREAREHLAQVAANQDEVPLMVQLVENPKFTIPGFSLFHGAVDLQQHDCIHIVLGRGLLEMDEAFVIGFTMGSTNKVSTTEEALFGWISKYLYPKVYQFSEENLAVFRDAVRLGYISSCVPLDEVNFNRLEDHSLAVIRRELGLEADLLLAYYGIEQRRYPESVASQRLLVNAR